MSSSGPSDSDSDSDSGSGFGLRGPRGCGEWAVVILGVVWVVLAVVFVIAIVLRLGG